MKSASQKKKKEKSRVREGITGVIRISSTDTQYVVRSSGSDFTSQHALNPNAITYGGSQNRDPVTQ